MANTKISNDYNIYYNDDSTNVKITYDAHTYLPLYYNDNMFNNCSNMIHNIQEGPRHDYVNNMANAYNNCWNLTGSPVCGDKVTNMANAYYCCYNLSGPIIQYGNGSRLNDITNAFSCCPNIYGTLYWNNSSGLGPYSFKNCFYGHNNTHQLNLYVLNGDTYNNIYLYKNNYGILGRTVTWTNINSNCFYSVTNNVYVGTGDCTFKD